MVWEKGQLGSSLQAANRKRVGRGVKQLSAKETTVVISTLKQRTAQLAELAASLKQIPPLQ